MFMSDHVTKNEFEMRILKKVNGLKMLSKKEQKAVNGGYACVDGYRCPPGSYCVRGLCRSIED